jgi:hypothetical protein
MSIWTVIKGLFAAGLPGPQDARRLDASSEAALGHSLQWLPVGEPGWITLADARRLFSHKDDQYAFGETDEEGQGRLAAFAAESGHRSDYEFMPTEGRVYFVRPNP